MFQNHINWSDKTLEDRSYLKRIDDLYRKALESVEGGKLYGCDININNPKEVIAMLFVLYQDYSLFHERL
jgi:hypothetical protein